MTDQALIDGLSQGSQAAADYLYEHYHPVITKQLRTKGLDASAAEDIFHDALLSELRRRKSHPLTLETATYKTYFKTICNNLYKNHCRWNKRRAYVTLDEVTLPGEEAVVERELESSEYQKILDDAFDAIGSPCKELLRQRLVLKIKTDKIAEMLSITPDAARQRVSRCNKRLREIIKRDPRHREMKE